MSNENLIQAAGIVRGWQTRHKFTRGEWLPCDELFYEYNKNHTEESGVEVREVFTGTLEQFRAALTETKPAEQQGEQRVPEGPVMHKQSGMVFDTVLCAVNPDDLIPLTPHISTDEPVCYRTPNWSHNNDEYPWIYRDPDDRSVNAKGEPVGEPLYLHLPDRVKAEPLTEAQVARLTRSIKAIYNGVPFLAVLQLVRAVEAELGIKAPASSSEP